MRLTHQLYSSNGIGDFVTLTYSDEYLPFLGTLVKKDLQDFFKRLRGKFKRKYNRKIKYYSCGEYGGKHGRPHYHAIIYGVDQRKPEEKKLLEECWTYGRIGHGTVTADSMRYTADYLMTKDLRENGAATIEAYAPLLPPFQTCSQGIGLEYLYTHQKQIEQEGTINYKGKKMSLPKYYASKVEIPVNVKGKIKLERIKKKLKKHNLTIEKYLYQTGNKLIDPDNITYEQMAQMELNIDAKLKLSQDRKLSQTKFKGKLNGE